MTGSRLGKIFSVTTFGESHGQAIGGVIDGCPAGFDIDVAFIQNALDRRRPGQSKYTTQRQELDQVQIISGVFEGKTTGTPICLMIQNEDAKSKDYEAIRDIFRPGHADFTYHHKYGHRDHRGGGRSSARETAVRVAAGAIAQSYLKQKYNIIIQGYLAQMGSIKLICKDLSLTGQNPFFCPNLDQVDDLAHYIHLLRKEGDSIGARVNVHAFNVPIGLGEPVFDKLDAELARAMMSINAAKGVEIGAGFDCVTQKGSEHRDEIRQTGFLSNHAGGILGGISTGQAIEVSVAFKPTSSIVKPGKTVTIHNEETVVQTKGRHDPCVGIRAVPIVEAMMALVLMDQVLLAKSRDQI